MFNKWNDILRQHADRLVESHRTASAGLRRPVLLLIDPAQGTARQAAERLAEQTGRSQRLDQWSRAVEGGGQLPIVTISLEAEDALALLPADAALGQRLQAEATGESVAILCLDGDAAVPVSIRRPPPPDEPAPHQRNRQAWDDRARRAHQVVRPLSEGELIEELRTLDPYGWLEGDLRGKRVLCLAGGGGRQSALFALAGAEVTVCDLSTEMLALDRQVAEQHGRSVETVEASMDDLSALPPASFQVVYQPTSSCYVPNLAAVYREVARVCQPGGIYISQHKQPRSLQAEAEPSGDGYRVVHRSNYRGPLPEVTGSDHREEGMDEYLHGWEELVGGLCRAGFVVEDLSEPKLADPTSPPGSFAHRSAYLPPYVRLKARRVADRSGAQRPLEFWS